jgi:hypothetical protein
MCMLPKVDLQFINISTKQDQRRGEILLHPNCSPNEIRKSSRSLNPTNKNHILPHDIPHERKGTANVIRPPKQGVSRHKIKCILKIYKTREHFGIALSSLFNDSKKCKKVTDGLIIPPQTCFPLVKAYISPKFQKAICSSSISSG